VLFWRFLDLEAEVDEEDKEDEEEDEANECMFILNLRLF